MEVRFEKRADVIRVFGTWEMSRRNIWSWYDKVFANRFGDTIELLSKRIRGCAPAVSHARQKRRFERKTWGGK